MNIDLKVLGKFITKRPKWVISILMILCSMYLSFEAEEGDISSTFGTTDKAMN